MFLAQLCIHCGWTELGSEWSPGLLWGSQSSSCCRLFHNEVSIALFSLCCQFHKGNIKYLNNMKYLVAESCWHHVMDECIVFRLNLPLNPQDCSTGFSLSHDRCPRHYPLTLWLTQTPTHAHSGCCWLASTLPWPFAHGSLWGVVGNRLAQQGSNLMRQMVVYVCAE